MTIGAKFITSAQKLNQCPDFVLPEFALIGRSNVGKSTFINTLSGNNKLALTSSKPGKTRLINLFNFSDKFIIADLPGYGYSVVSKAMKEQWQVNLEEYLLNRKNLVSLIQFVDARHEIQKNDFQMREWIDAYNLNVITVLTKSDYLSRNELNKRIFEVKKAFGEEVFPFAKGNGFYAKEMLKELMSEKYKVAK